MHDHAQPHDHPHGHDHAHPHPHPGHTPPASPAAQPAFWLWPLPQRLLLAAGVVALVWALVLWARWEVLA